MGSEMCIRDRIEAVLGEARVVRADVERVVEVHTLLLGTLRTDTGRRIRRCRSRELTFPLGDLGDDGVDGRVFVFQRQQQPGQPAQRPGGGHRLRQRLLPETGGALSHESPFACRLFRQHAFLANLYKIAILYA